MPALLTLILQGGHVLAAKLVPLLSGVFTTKFTTTFTQDDISFASRGLRLYNLPFPKLFLATITSSRQYFRLV